jgi:hypothetical protein
MAKRQSPHNRKLTDTETKGSLIRASHRLARHFASFLAGEIGAEDDLSAILRTLVCDNVLGSVMDRFKLVSPNIVVTQPANGEASTLFSVGALLTPRDYKFSRHAPQKPVTFTQWASQVCLVIEPNPSHRVFTWHSFINTAANTWGSHAAPTMPRVLDETSVHLFDGRPIGSFLIRNAATVVAVVLESILEQLGLSDEAAPMSHQDNGPIALAWLRVHDLGLEAEVRAVPGLRTGTPPGEYEIVDVPLRSEARMTISFVLDKTGNVSIGNRTSPAGLKRHEYRERIRL